jgi:hypothetical protein
MTLSKQKRDPMNTKSTWKRRLVLVLIAFLSVGISMLGVGTFLCTAAIPETSVNGSINDFMHNNETTSLELLQLTLEYIRNSTFFVANSGSSFVLRGEFQCRGTSCELRHFVTDVAIQRYFSCFGRNPSNVRIVSFDYDFENDRLLTMSYAADAGNFISSFQLTNVTPTMEMALQESLDRHVDILYNEEASFNATVYLSRGHWVVTARDVADNELFVDRVPFEP